MKVPFDGTSSLSNTSYRWVLSRTASVVPGPSRPSHDWVRSYLDITFRETDAAPSHARDAYETREAQNAAQAATLLPSDLTGLLAHCLEKNLSTTQHACRVTSYVSQILSRHHWTRSISAMPLWIRIQVFKRGIRKMSGTVTTSKTTKAFGKREPICPLACSIMRGKRLGWTHSISTNILKRSSRLSRQEAHCRPV